MEGYSVRVNSLKSRRGAVADRTSSIRIRTSLHDGVTTVRCIISHPMETGFNKDPKTGFLIPPHFIKEVVCKHNDKIVLRCDWSRAISRNPYLSFKFSGAKAGDNITISWHDTEGASDSATAVITQ